MLKKSCLKNTSLNAKELQKLYSKLCNYVHPTKEAMERELELLNNHNARLICRHDSGEFNRLLDLFEKVYDSIIQIIEYNINHEPPYWEKGD